MAGPGGFLGLVVSSRHHRQGGSRRASTHRTGSLLLVCGDGSRGCHGWLEGRERRVARERGWIVDKAVEDPATVPVVLPSGRLVYLSDTSAQYEDVPGGPVWVTETVEQMVARFATERRHTPPP
jgi:hypothetical protein